MRDLSRFLENPFDDDGISLAELLAFTTDHLQKLTALNTGGQFTARLTATSSALQLVGSMATDDVVKLGVREAAKAAKDAFRDGLPEQIGKVHGGVVAKYGPKSPQVTAVFPEGRSIFSSVGDDGLKDKLSAVVTAITARQADLGAPLVAEAQAIYDGWMALYNPSEASSGGKKASEAAKKEARNNLQLMLFLNLLTLAMMFPRQPEKLSLYMQQSLLEDRPQQPAPPTPPGP